MMKRYTHRVALAAALVCLPVLAAAQLFGNFPIVGGASYCAGFATGTSGQVCNVTVPAGPSELTGDETVPADTNLSQGRQPQTVKLPVGQLGAGPTTFNAPLTGASITVTANTRRLIITPAGTIATLTVVLPTAAQLAAANNQLFGFCSTQIVTALTVTAGSGTTVSNAPTAMTVPVTTGAASCVEWVYRLSNTTWYRVQ